MEGNPSFVILKVFDTCGTAVDDDYHTIVVAATTAIAPFFQALCGGEAALLHSNNRGSLAQHCLHSQKALYFVSEHKAFSDCTWWRSQCHHPASPPRL